MERLPISVGMRDPLSPRRHTQTFPTPEGLGIGETGLAFQTHRAPLGSWDRKERARLQGSAPTRSWPTQELEKYSSGPTGPLAPFLHELFLLLPGSVAAPEQNPDLCTK